jgi:hypothetical protein
MARRTRRGKSKHQRNGELLSLAQLLDRTYPGQPRDRPLVRTFSWWDRTVPERVAANARPVRLAGGTLIVHTRSSAWAQELSFHERDLLESVRAAVPSVRRLRIRVGRMPPPPPPPEKPPPKTVPLSIGELPGEVARALAGVGDDRLRDTLTKAACTSLAPPPRDGDGDGGDRGRG